MRIPSLGPAAILLWTTIQSSAPDLPVARYRGGVVTSADLASFRSFRELQPSGSAAKTSLQAEVEHIVLLSVLGRRFQGLPASAQREQEIRFRHWRLGLAETRLREAVRQGVAATEEEIRKAFEADPSAYAQPRYWQLENILKRFPEGATPEERSRLREVMERLRERVAKGEDFGELARKESESETRLRGGNLGAVRLDQLAPAVAAAVSRLGPGELSAVIESDEGLSLLRCIQIVEAEPASLDKARRTISLRLTEGRFTKEWDALVSRLDAESQAEYPAVDVSSGGPGDVLATCVSGDTRASITREDFALQASSLGIDVAAAPSGSLRKRLVERVRQEAFLREAERRGLLARPDDATLFEWTAREMRARAVEKVEVESGVPAPGESEMRALYEERKDKFLSPGRVTLRALKLPLERERPRSVYEKARKVGERLASGTMGFEEAVAALKPDAELVELGTLTDDEVWLMGLNVDTAVAAAAAGATTRLLQEGRTLWIFHVVAKQPGRKLSFEEARDQISRVLIATARRRAVADFRRRLIGEQGVSLTP